MLCRRIRPIILFGLVFCLGCDFASPARNTATSDSQSPKDGQLDAEDVIAKPAYVLAEPAALEDLTGINGGYRFQFEPQDYGGEWVQATNSDVVRFFVVDVAGAKNVAVVAEGFWIKTQDNVLFSLDPDDPDGDRGSHAYSLEDRNLALAMGSSVEVMMTLDGKTYRATLNLGQQSGTSDISTVDE